MSIFKGTFKPGVEKQINKRQEVKLRRNPKDLIYLNAKTAWIRMSSSVDVAGSKRLAEQYVLLGGMLLDNTSLRFGVKDTDGSYNFRTPSGNNHRLGLKPMPGITGIQVQSKAAYGSLRQITVNFQCWDIKQLEDLELLYMRPGYSVLVEWGWAPYIDSEGNMKSDIPKPVDLINKTPGTKEEIFTALFKQAEDSGNYDALYGLVKNYSWSARPDGGYDCVTEIISIGEVIESLKINYGAYDSPIGKEGEKGLFGLQIENDSFVAEAYAQNKIAGICAELFYLRSQNDALDTETTLTATLGGFLGLGVNTYVTPSLFMTKIEIENKEEEDKNIFNDDKQVYIKLGDFADILNKHVLLGDGKRPIAEISLKEGEHMDSPGSPLLCLGHSLQLSVNPTVCLIKNEAWLSPKSQGFTDGLWNDYTKLKEITNGLLSSYWGNRGYEKTQLATIARLASALATQFFINRLSRGPSTTRTGS